MAGRGNPGKSGTLEELFEVALRNLPSDSLKQISFNIDLLVGVPTDVSIVRRFKVGDLEILSRLRKIVDDKASKEKPHSS